MRNGQIIRQWQIQRWLAKSRRPLTTEEIKEALGLKCTRKTVQRDLEVLSQVFSIMKTGRKWEDTDKKWDTSLEYEYSIKGVNSNVPKYGPLKRCTNCRLLKDRATAFWRDWKEPDERQRRCVDCMKKINPEIRRQSSLKYYYRHRDEINKKRTQRRQEEAV